MNKKQTKPTRTVPASNFVGTVANNVDNDELSDKEFRQFIRNTLPIVIFDGCEKYDENRDSLGQCLSCHDPVYTKEFTVDFCSQECVDAHFNHERDK